MTIAITKDADTIHREAREATLARMKAEGETAEIGLYTSEDYYRLTHLRELLEYAENLGIELKMQDGKLLIVAPMLNVWTNGEHGFLVDMEDAEDVGYALDVVTDEYAECEDPEGCDVCDYGADLDNA
jgi:hypothetical protein